METLDFSWKDGRRAGVFLHVSSLPSKFGIGNIGSSADGFLEFCSKAGFSYWQICPLGPTGYGDSPYQSFSAFAGNPYFIDPESFASAKLASDMELLPLRALSDARCDFGALYSIFPKLVKKVSERYFALSESDREIAGQKLSAAGNFEHFCVTNAKWLDSYALFSALKNKFEGNPWWLWPRPFKNYAEAKKAKLDFETENDVKCAQFAQWIFFGQYEIFRRKARKAGVEIFGDIPIFLAHDSAEAWSRPEILDLDKSGTPKNVAGVGPDYFCEDGQLWGNPLYDWEGAKSAVYDFWRERVASALKMYDMIRFDHFRGFADYWAIPYKLGDARKGVWKKGPGIEFFRYLKKKFPDGRFVAEDLGILSEEACKLRDSTGMPSMAVLQFAFGGDSKNSHLPHNLSRNCVYYTGTHDNTTSKDWYANASEVERDRFRRYFRVSGECANWDMIHAAIMSVARVAVITMQDILSCGGDCRMNTPGKADGNWQWRMTNQQLNLAVRENAPYLRSINSLADRLIPPATSGENNVEK